MDAPQTERIVQKRGEIRDHALYHHAQEMEDGLRAALRELDRVNNVKDGQPLVSHNLLYNLRSRLG